MWSPGSRTPPGHSWRAQGGHLAQTEPPTLCPPTTEDAKEMCFVGSLLSLQHPEFCPPHCGREEGLISVY